MFIAFLERERGMAGVGSLAMVMEGCVRRGGISCSEGILVCQ